MAPAAAAVAVIAIAVTLVVVKDARTTQPVPLSQAAFPAYYVALNDALSQEAPDQVVVGSTVTGTRLATVSPPAHSSFVGISGAADDRTFVVGAEAFPFSAASWPVESQTWYLLRIAPGTDHPARLTRLPIPATPFGLLVEGMALSPNGRELALLLEPNQTINTGPETLRVYSVATGALLGTWTGPPSNTMYVASMGTDNNTTLTWLANGHTVIFDYGAGGRTLDTSRPGHDLIADSQPIAWSTPSDCGPPAFSSDGKAVVCFGEQSSSGVTGGSCSPAFYEFSTVTGKLISTLYRARCGTGDVLWLSSSGDALIGYMNSSGIQGMPGGVVGVIAQGTFSRLSFPLASGAPVPGAVAW
jgi:hypothetical protein